MNEPNENINEKDIKIEQTKKQSQKNNQSVLKNQTVLNNDQSQTQSISEQKQQQIPQKSLKEGMTTNKVETKEQKQASRQQICNQPIQEEKNIGEKIKQDQQAEQKRKSYFRQAEQKREEAFSQMRLFVQQFNNSFQSYKRQIKQTIDKTKEEKQKLQQRQQIKTLKFNAEKQKKEVQNLKREIQMKNKLLKQSERALQNLKDIYDRKEEQQRSEIIRLEVNYKKTEKSFRDQLQLLQQTYQIKMKQAEQKIKNKYQTKLTKRIQSQQILVTSKQEISSKLYISEEKFELYKLSAQKKIKKTQSLLSDANQQIKGLKQQKAVLESQLYQLQQQKDKNYSEIIAKKTAYQQRTKHLQNEFWQFKDKCKQQKQRQLKIMQSNHNDQINQLKNKTKSVFISIKQEINALKQQKETLKIQKEELNNKLIVMSQQMIEHEKVFNRIQTILYKYQVKQEIFRKQLVTLTQQLISSLDIKAQESRKSLKIEQQKTQKLIQTTNLNKIFLKNVQTKLMSGQPINKLQKVPQQEQNPHHFGKLFNKILYKLKQSFNKQHQARQKISNEVLSLKQVNQKLKKNLEVESSTLSKIKQKNTKLETQNYKYSTQQQVLQQQLKSLKNEKIRRVQLQTQIKSIKSEFLQQQSIIAELKINLQAKQSQQSENQYRIKQFQQTIKQISKQLQIQTNQTKLKQQLVQTLNIKLKQRQTKIQTFQLKITYLQAESDKLRNQMSLKQRIIRNEQDEIIQKISSVTEYVFEKKLQNKSIDGIVSFISENANGSKNTTFIVSQILERMPKQRQFLIQECCKFFGTKYISTKLSFKYNQFCKDFSNYLPAPSKKFFFAVIMKTKRNVVFGVISDSLGPGSKAFAFNLQTKKIMTKSQRTRLSSSKYESSMLRFGGDQIVIKNNSSLNIKVNTFIIGEKYFEFSRQDLIGKGENGETVQLESLEIHKIIAI